MARPILLISLFAASALRAVAIVPDNGPDSDFTFVGQVGGASGVAIGVRSVITAKHVGGMSFTVGGSTFNAVSRINHATYDLSVLNFDTDLPGFYSIADTSSIGSTLTMVGFGQTGVENATGTGYAITGGAGTRRKGDNALHGKQFVTDFGPSLLSFLEFSGEAAVANGDSGGGFFMGGELVGVNSFIFTTNENLPAYGFASVNGGTPYFGSGAIDLTDPGVRAWVNQAVPEPATMLAFGVGLAALARRRRR